MKKFPLHSLVAALVIATSIANEAAAISWDDAGNSASKLWDDNGNWNPDGDPDNQDVFIGDLPTAANDTTLIDRFYSINSLTITNGADVVNSTDNGATNDFELIVNGHTSVSGTGSSIILFGGDPDGLDTNTLEIGSGGSVILNSHTSQGTAVVEVDGGTGAADFDMLAGGTLTGTGRIDLESSLASATVVMSNSGSIIANTAPAFFGLAPAAGTLQITANDVDARFDWDGTGAGVLQANGNQTLDIDVNPGNDAFSGTMNLGTGSNIDIANAWTLDSGTINANTPAFGLIIPPNDPLPGPAAHIAGASWTMSGGNINIDDRWDSLQFDSAMTTTGGTIANTGTVIFNNTTTIGAGTDFQMLGGDSKLTVADGAIVTINDADFNLDGTEGAGNITTIGLGALLDINLAAAAADDSYGHTINLNGGELDVVNSATTTPWAIFSSGVINAGGGAASTLDGDNLTIFGTVNIDNNSTLSINTADVLFENATINVAAGGNLNVNTLARYENSSFSITGLGTFDPGTFTIGVDETDFANVVWNVAIVDLDDGGEKFINDRSTLTINADSIDPNDNVFNDNSTIVDEGQLTVQLTGNVPFIWDTGTLNYNGDTTINPFIGASNSPMEFRATMNVNGDGQIMTRLDLVNATVNINDLGERLRLSGGSRTPGNTNTMEGTTINGPGVLQLDNNTALRGNGVINAVIDDNGSADIIAEGGILTLGGSIVDIGLLGTFGSDAVLNVTNAWNTSAAINGVRLNNGRLTGALATNDGAAGITGFGVISAPIENNSHVTADNGTLTLFNQSPGLLDGATDGGLLRARTGNLVVQYAFNTTVDYNGRVEVDTGQEVFGDSTLWNFQPGSVLELTGGTFRSNRVSQFGGSILAVTGTEGVISNPLRAEFLSTSTTTLNGDLRLVGLSEIASGAIFNGGGTLIIDTGSTLTLLDGADVDVLLENRGKLLLGASPGQVTGQDFQQTSAGSLEIELEGTGLNDFDRMSLTGLAQLSGEVTVSLIGGFDPQLNDVFTILSAAGSVINEFDVIDFTAAPLGAGLAWDVVYNPTNVQLKIVSAPLFTADFDNDGDVDGDDLTEWQAAYGVNANADANGDGLSDGSDFIEWQRQFGSGIPVSAAVTTATQIPEPGTLALGLLLGIVGMIARREVNC